MILVGDLGTYLHAIGLDPTVPVFPGALVDLNGLSDRALFISPTGGPGLLLEGATDVIGFQFRTRGAQGDAASAYADAEGLAKQVDDLVVTAAYPTTIGGRTVIRLYRVGGGPAYLSRVSQRASFTCGYLFEIAAT